MHCGFCTATCPTYALLGDELDSPRGRIYLIKDMLENDRPATEDVVKHIDRCLSCLSGMSTCPSGVNYMHLVDHARRHIEHTYRRPRLDRAFRRLLGFVLPRPHLFRAALSASRLAWGWGTATGFETAWRPISELTRQRQGQFEVRFLALCVYVIPPDDGRGPSQSAPQAAASKPNRTPAVSIWVVLNPLWKAQQAAIQSVR